MKTPYVSCIMPTANRDLYIPLAVDYFLNQDYRDAELIIIDDGKVSVRDLLPDHYRIRYYYTAPLGTIGAKRNYACELAKGEIIMHWDDDDYYAHDWISKQVDALEQSGADICGLDEIIFFSPLRKKYWSYAGSEPGRPWLAGATMAYWKFFWEKHPFKDLQIGEDYDYVWNSGATIHAHDYRDGFIATLHARNTTLKTFENPIDKKNASPFMKVTFEGNAENPETE
ncbi:glycosyltransferase family A protein [Mucilaginibacter sp. UR6-11]|uniref:glycosyltransferase family 2 protein n=1 Tax=Mucilaginibacter sp. UR6-11 TaxID=1435644 RepID=UPI001E4E2156|nr:glycosyltransferase family A protein [Mucilaginibacter sp. UR6-11]MCC8423672.1 glycosyltransferase family 2 protein [Mucilaginibacter sp. UR6-11]